MDLPPITIRLMPPEIMESAKNTIGHDEYRDRNRSLVHILSIVLSIVLLGSVSSCTTRSSKSSRAHAVKYDFDESPTKYGDDFDWQTKSPADFIERLKVTREPHPVYSVVGIHYGWVKDIDVATLIARLDSEVECAHVSLNKSSHVPTTPSSEGHQAAYLLEGYRKGYYPPDLSSTYFMPDKAEIRAWYKTWSSQKRR